MGKLTLEKRHLMTAFIDPQEAQIAILSDSAIFTAIHDERLVARGSELICVGVIDGQADGLASKPIADEVCVTTRIVSL